MDSKRKRHDVWGDVKSADIMETQAKRANSASVHVEHVHGSFINLTLPPGTPIGAVLAEISARSKEPACDA